MTHPLYVMNINLAQRPSLSAHIRWLHRGGGGEQSRRWNNNLHQHEGIKGLHRVQNRLDQMCPLIHLRLVLPYRPRQRRSLSNDVASKVPR